MKHLTCLIVLLVITLEVFCQTEYKIKPGIKNGYVSTVNKSDNGYWISCGTHNGIKLGKNEEIIFYDKNWKQKNSVVIERATFGSRLLSNKEGKIIYALEVPDDEKQSFFFKVHKITEDGTKQDFSLKPNELLSLIPEFNQFGIEGAYVDNNNSLFFLVSCAESKSNIHSFYLLKLSSQFKIDAIDLDITTDYDKYYNCYEGYWEIVGGSDNNIFISRPFIDFKSDFKYGSGSTGTWAKKGLEIGSNKLQYLVVSTDLKEKNKYEMEIDLGGFVPTATKNYSTPSGNTLYKVNRSYNWMEEDIGNPYKQNAFGHSYVCQNSLFYYGYYDTPGTNGRMGCFLLKCSSDGKLHFTKSYPIVEDYNKVIKGKPSNKAITYTNIANTTIDALTYFLVDSRRDVPFYLLKIDANSGKKYGSRKLEFTSKSIATNDDLIDYLDSRINHDDIFEKHIKDGYNSKNQELYFLDGHDGLNVIKDQLDYNHPGEITIYYYE